MKTLTWLERFLDFRIALVMLGLSLLAALVSIYYFKSAPFGRKEFILRHFRHVYWQLPLAVVLSLAYRHLDGVLHDLVGLSTLVLGLYLAIIIFRVYFSMLLFAKHPRDGVPMLSIDVGTILFSLVLILYVVKYAFKIDLASLLATSAVLSLILGLALQDTLGNIMAGVALSMNPPFEIGDWIELRGTGSGNILGKVEDIHWRSVVVSTLTHDLVSIPNKTLSSFPIVNFTHTNQPLLRVFNVKLDRNGDLEKARDIMLDALRSHWNVMPAPPAEIYLSEVTEMGATFRLFYTPKDFAYQLTTVDHFYQRALPLLKAEGIGLATIDVRGLSS